MSDWPNLILKPNEFFDRFTILIRKAHFDVLYIQELERFISALNNCKIDSHLLLLVCQLQMINVDIWNLESDIRMGKENLLGIKEIGERALKIRDLNRIRMEIGNKINSHFEVNFIERKIDHAFE